MKKLPECDRCYFFAHSPHLVCSLHPVGVEPEAEACLDYLPDPSLKSEVWQQPLNVGMYAGEIIRQPEPRLREQQLQWIETHPLFTNQCPACGHKFVVALLVHYDCPACGWIDDSI